MIYRIKFRIHGGQNPGKFVYNLPAGAELHLSSYFRPVTEIEPSVYSLQVREGRTLITLKDRKASWNGKQASADIFEIRPGHIMTITGITVEILDCPEVKSKNREETQFLDLKALMSPPVEAAHLKASQALSEQPVQMEPVVPAQFQMDQDPPDRVVLPISLIRPEEPERKKPEIFIAKAPAKKLEPEDGDEHIKQRKRNLQKAGAVACFFVLSIFVANQVARRYFILFDEDDFGPVAAQVAELPKRASAPVPEPESSPSRGLASVEAQPVIPLAEMESPVTTSEKPSDLAQAAPASPVAESDPVASSAVAGAEKELMGAIEEGNLKKVTKLIEEQGVSADFTLDELGRSPFLRAAANGRVSIMQYLLTKNVAGHADYHGNDALMWASINGHEKTAAFLLSKGFRPDAKREDGKTALTLARNYHQAPIEKLFMAAKISRGSNSRTPASKK
jgi:hypothetical protein